MEHDKTTRIKYPYLRCIEKVDPGLALLSRVSVLFIFDV
jgi:hypothetical protein